MPPESSQNLLAYTPMIHARIFAETVKYRNSSFQPTRAGLATLPDHTNTTSEPYLDGNPSIDRPLFVQFCANSPNLLLEAARYVEPFCDAVDLNLGCPQGIAKKGHYGSFLQEDWDLIYQLINKLHKDLAVPVTAKIRILETKEKTLDYAKVILSAGASILTVHGRQRDQKGHKTGLADWSVIRYLRDNLPRETVIFANGNILQHEDIEKCLEQTGADGVMSAEGNLCDPTIFAGAPAAGNQTEGYWKGQHNRGGYRMDAVFRRYMDIIYEHILEQPPPCRKPLFSGKLRADEPLQVSESGGAELKSIDSSDLRDSCEISLKPDGQQDAKGEDHPNSTKSKKARPTSPNLLAMQPHLFHLLRPLLTKHTKIRNALACCRGGDLAAFENVLSMVEEAVQEGITDYESDPSKFDEELVIHSTDGYRRLPQDNTDSTAAAIDACRKPWWICQPYVRPSPAEALEIGSLQLSQKERLKNKIDNAGSAITPKHSEEKLASLPTEKRRIAEMPEETMIYG